MSRQRDTTIEDAMKANAASRVQQAFESDKMARTATDPVPPKPRSPAPEEGSRKDDPDQGEG
jgi:hypothetical protein